jgi:protein TonB
MNHNIAILDLPAPSLSPERAARSFYAERIPLSPPLPDRDLKWRWGVAILAALLLHLAVLTTIDDGFLRKKSPEPAPIPVEVVTELPKPPPPEEKPAEKPQQQKPPEPQQPASQQPAPPQSSGGDLPDKVQGALPATAAEDRLPPPATAPPPSAPEQPAQTTMPALPNEASPEAVPVPPASSPREIQQTLIAPPVPLKKPPAAPARQTTTTAPPQPDVPASSTVPDLRLGEGGGNKYLNALRDKVSSHRYYPPTAEMFHWEGVPSYTIAINRKGELLGVRLEQSSGYAILDKAGQVAIQNSAPFGPVPPDLAGDPIYLTLTIPYVTD